MASNNSGKKKKQSIDDLLTQDIPQGPIRRGVGMKTSFEEASQVQAVIPITEDIARSHDRTNAPVRVNRGYKLREDLIKQCKQVALDDGKKFYEVMEEALEEYLQRRK